MTPETPPPLPAYPSVIRLPPAPEEPLDFHLTWVPLGMFLLAAGVLGCLELNGMESQDSAFRLGMFIGHAAVMFLLPMLFSLLVWALAGRKQIAATTVFCVLLALVFGLQLIQVRRGQQRAAVLARYNEARRAALAEQKRHAESIDPAKDGRHDQPPADARSIPAGLDPEIVAAVAAVGTTEQALIREYRGVCERILAAGGVSPLGLLKMQDITDRRQMLAAAQDANHRLTQCIKNMEPQLRAQLRHGGLPDAVIDAVAGSCMRGAHIDLQLRVREAHRRLLEANDGMLVTFGQYWGHWSVDATGKVLFDSDAAVSRYGGYYVLFKQATAEATVTEKQLADAQRSTLAAP